ncbi:LytTR family transcriptional regulator [Mycobacterium kubicae]|uniref:LCP family protein n=1 Tax=Mycobacterium kubicae TaxID=120959 RepID=UPI0007FC6B52|nr:LCP family protein [Mycobacterium kubicae]OBF15604.1 LytTR family transcriptional regulator [Mycobacterium kubicae]
MNGERPGPGPRGPVPPRPVRREPSQIIRRDGAPPGPPRQVVPPRPMAPAPQPVVPPPRQMPPPPRPVAPPPRPSRARTKRHWGRRLASVLLVSLLLMGTVIVGGAIWFDTAVRREAVLLDYPDRPTAGSGTNWLLVGSDSRQDLTAQQQEELATGGDVGSGRTDTILLVHLPGFTSSTPTTVVSIPRDSYVPIPGHGRDKINAAFVLGGASLLAQTVEQATGLRLDHYAEVGFGGFAVLVDALGGVRVCPAEPISDPLAGINLPAGCQHLDGRSALGYVRTRATPRADLDRMINQRQFMSALLHRAASPAVYLNPWRWYTVPRAAAGALTVDRGDHVWDLARLAWALNGSTTSMTVPIGDFSDSAVGSVVVWNHDAARALFDALASDAAVPTSLINEQP